MVLRLLLILACGALGAVEQAQAQETYLVVDPSYPVTLGFFHAGGVRFGLEHTWKKTWDGELLVELGRLPWVGWQALELQVHWHPFKPLQSFFLEVAANGTLYSYNVGTASELSIGEFLLPGAGFQVRVGSTWFICLDTQLHLPFLQLYQPLATKTTLPQDISTSTLLTVGLRL